MSIATQTGPANKILPRVGLVLSALAVLFLIFDGVIKVLVIAPVVESFDMIGYPASLAVGIGLLELACIAVYLVPRSAIIGAVLLTGYLGGAIASHVRVGSPVFSLVFPLIIGALLWGGLYLRDGRVRALIEPRG
jgi:hypothetical protein